MIINIIFAHDECSISQMNIKSLSLNEENENFEYTSWRHNMFQGPRKRGCYNWGEYGITLCSPDWQVNF